MAFTMLVAKSVVIIFLNRKVRSVSKIPYGASDVERKKLNFINSRQKKLQSGQN